MSDLTPREAARHIGRTERMVRYLLKSGKLAGTKVDGQWRIAPAALESLLSDAERAEHRQRADDLKQRVADAVDATAPAAPDGAKRGFYSVRDLRLLGETRQLLRDLATLATQSGHAERFSPVAESLRFFLRHLTDGTHQFDAAVKIDRLTRARSALCAALSDLLAVEDMLPDGAVSTLADRLEGGLLRSLNGLLRRVEKRRRADPSRAAS